MSDLSDRLAEEFASGAADLTRVSTPAAIPTPAEDLSSLLKSVRAIKTALDTLTGNAGSALDKAVTTRDMLNEGVFAFSPSTGLSAGARTGGFTGSFPGGPGGGDGYVDPRPVLLTPPTPTNLQANGSFRTIILTWDLFNYRNHAYTEIWRNTVDNQATAVLLDSVDGTVYADASGSLGATYWYWVRAVNDQGTVGAFNDIGGTAAALLRIGGSDIAGLSIEAANLADGSVTASKIAALAIDATKFATSIEPISIIVGSSVPTILTTRNIYLTGTSRLYRWDGSAYVLSVPAADITGQLTSAQIASITAAQLTGQIGSTQIADDAITTPKLSAGAVTSAEIAAGTIVAGNIAAGTITGTQIAAGSVSADRLVANSITAGQIAAGAIGTDQLAANAVTTGKLLVTGRGRALNDDPTLSDASAWTIDTPITIQSPTNAPGAAGARYFFHPGDGTSNRFVQTRRVAIDPAKTYRLTANLFADTGNNRNQYIFVRMWNSAGGELSGADTGWGGTLAGYVFGDLTPTGVWTRQGATFGAGTSRPIPASVREIAVGVWFQYSVGTGNVAQGAQDIRLEESVGFDLIVDGGIIASHLAANSIAVGTAAIQNGAIANAMLGNAVVDSAKIADAAIVTAKIGDAQITTAKIGDAQITAAKIADAQIGNAKITDLSATKITAGSIGVSSFIQSTGYTAGVSGWRINGDGTAEFSGVLVRGTITGSTITGTTITGSTITGGVIQTASSGQRVVLNESSSNEARFYGNRGDGTIVQLAAIGLIPDGSDFVIGQFGTTASTRIGVLAYASTADAVRGSSGTGSGVYGFSNSNQGVTGISSGSYGVQGTGPTYGVYGISASAGGAGVNGTSTDGPGTRGSTTGSGSGVVGVGSGSGHGGHFTGNSTRSPLFLTTHTSPPSNAALGSLAIINTTELGYRLCYADGGNWRRVLDDQLWNYVTPGGP